MSISKEEILEMSHGGLDFYRLVIPDLQVIGDRCKNTYNPFYEDKNPSLSIFLKDGKWYHKDHGHQEFSGDFIDFGATFFKLDIGSQFSELLEKMHEALIKADLPELKHQKLHALRRKSQKSEFSLIERAFNQLELNYFARYGITLDNLNQHRVVAIDGYTATNSYGKMYSINRREEEMMFAFKGFKFAKIYVPKPKSFVYVGNKPPDYFFGWDLIDTGDGDHYLMDHLIITAGEKDVMTVWGLGYEFVIALNSETAGLDEKFAQQLKYHSNDKVAVLYDLDDTGQKASHALAEKYGFREIILPDSLKEAGGKDVSDYVALKLDIGTLKALIDAAIAESPEEHPGELSAIDDEEEPLDDEKEEALPLKKETKEKPEPLSDGPPPNNGYDDDPMPYLPEDIFDMLPDILKESCELFDDRRQKDLYLLSALSVLSGCFPMIRGIYDDDETACNLYTMIVAPPASGKGAMKWARKLANKVAEQIKDEYVDMFRRIKAAEKRVKDGKESEGERLEDIESVRKTLFVPADISFSAMVELLDDNKGFGIIFDTEADVVNRMFVTEWGQYSTILRKAFHGEPISLMRKMFNTFIEIEFPVLSVALSGTKDQLVNLVQEVDNGLFSRILFYQFQHMAVWRDPWRRKDSMREKFLAFADRVLDLYIMLPEEITFDLEPDQKSEFNAFFEQWTEEVNREREGQGIEILFRIGIITYRITILLSLLRLEYEASSRTIDKVFCNLKDLYIALRIADILRVHSFEIYNDLAGYPSRVLSFSQDVRMYYHELPDVFTRKEADAFATKLDIKLSTAEKWLEKFIEEKLIERTKYGQYSKIKIRRK